MQEAVARAWDRSRRGLEIRNLDAWVTRVALNLSHSRLRRLRAEARALDRSGHRPSPDEPRAEPVDVERALARLPRRQREVTVLRYYLGLDVAEIASALGVHEGTVKTTLFRARQALAASLGADDPEEANDRAPLG